MINEKIKECISLSFSLKSVQIDLKNIDLENVVETSREGIKLYTLNISFIIIYSSLHEESHYLQNLA